MVTATITDLISIPNTTLNVPANAEANDELVTDMPMQVLEIDEDVALSLDPPSETIAISPPVVGPNSPFRLMLLDPQKLKNSGGEKVKLQALALITGREQVIPIEVRTVTSLSVDSSNAPSFEKTEYDLILEQNFEEKEVAIVKLKSNPPPGTHFNLIGPLAERFSITNEGQLVYLTTIQCETACITPKTFTLLLEAVNDNSEQFTTLTFKAVGNEKLRFLNTSYDAIVQEKTGVFEKALKVTASGATEDIVYSVQDPTGLFSIHPKTGVLMVQHPEFLTRSDYGSMLPMTVIATDKKTLVSAPVYVTLKPKYEKRNFFSFTKSNYSFTVYPGQQIIGTVEVIDAENKTVLYDISEGGQGVITIDANGTLFYHRRPEKDSRNFMLLLTARSTGNQFFVATAWVNVTVEGIHSYPIDVTGSRQRSSVLSSSTKRGSTITEVEMTDDDDDGVVQLSLADISGLYVNGSLASLLTTEMIKIRTNGKTAVVLLNEPLDNLPVVSLTLTFEARDLAHDNEPPVIVTQNILVTRNGRMPSETPIPFKFIQTPTVVTIPADIAVGSMVVSPVLLQSVISPSIEYIYKIDSPSNAFRIDNATGVITIGRALDGVSQEFLTITASDPVTERSARVNLNVLVTPSNVHKLTFVQQQYSGSARKSDKIGTTVVEVKAISSHGDVVSYTLEGRDSVFLSIDNRGSISLKDTIAGIPLSELNFVTRASDGKSSITVPVHVSLTDEVEISFEKDSYNVTVMENVPVNGYILHPKLVQTDSTAGVEYFIEAENDANAIVELLQIDSDGRITAKEEFLGYVGTYEFHVRAILDGRDAMARVTLHILAAFTCIPRFLDDRNLEFTVEENSAVGTMIGTVSAAELDNKCELKYWLWDTVTHQYSNRTSFATISIDTGEIRSRIQFDYEKQAMYPLVLGLQAGFHQFVQMASTIRVLDVDDHPLSALLNSTTVEVPEDVSLGTVIATMRAVDVDDSQAVFYHWKHNSKEFSINSTTGEVTVVYELDREDIDSYSLEIIASNDDYYTSESVTVSMSLHIIVTDVNDNGPLFERSRYHVLVDKDTLPGQKVVTVSAFDPDLPVPGNDMSEVYYRIKETLFEYRGMSRPIEEMFSISSTSGVIQIEQTVSDFVGGVFHLLVESMDSPTATGAHKDQCIVKVYIHEESDIVRLDLPIPPAAMNYEKISNIEGTLANATGLMMIMKDLQYHHEEGKVLYDVTDLRLVLVNRTSSEIIPAERAIAIADKHRSAMGGGMPTMTKAQVLSTSVTPVSIPPIAYVLGVFALSLTLVFIIFAFMICHYRNRFQLEKKIHEGDKAIANALNRPPLRPMNISPAMTPTRMFAAHVPAINSGYAVQEMKIVVGGDDKQLQ